MHVCIQPRNMSKVLRSRQHLAKFDGENYCLMEWKESRASKISLEFSLPCIESVLTYI